MALDWDRVAELSSEERQVALLAAVDDAMAGATGPAEDTILETLPEPLRAIHVINWLDFEVSQGSLIAYLYNSHGRQAPLAIDLLTRIGATRMAAVLGQAVAVGASAAEEWVARQSVQQESGECQVSTPYLDPSVAGELEQLTTRYWEAADRDDWGARLDAYLASEIQKRAAR